HLFPLSLPTRRSSDLSLTGGTGNDNAKLVNDLVAISKAAEAARLTSRQTLLETQISDFGLLRSSFSTLQSAASALSNRDTFDARSEEHTSELQSRENL